MREKDLAEYFDTLKLEANKAPMVHHLAAAVFNDKGQLLTVGYNYLRCKPNPELGKRGSFDTR